MREILISIKPEWVEKILNGEKTIEYVVGYFKERLIKIYQNMKQRCYNPKTSRYERYGGRGIKVCDEWLEDRQKFINWSLVNGANEVLSIDRINTNGNYEPSNCRWTSMKIQQNNRRNNVKIEYNGKKYSIVQLSKILGIKYRTIHARLKTYNYNIYEVINSKLWDRVNKKSKSNEKYIYKINNKFYVQIKRIYYGSFKNIKDAINLRNQKLQELEKGEIK